MKHGCVLVALLVGIVGCDAAPANKPTEPVVTPLAIGAAFDPSGTGSVTGRVLWQGDLPTAPPFRAACSFADGQIVPGPIVRENPNLPRIDRHTLAVRGAVVFLRGIDPRKSMPWNLPPVEVEMRDLRLHVRQGNVDSPFGFVRQGDRIKMVSREKTLHVLWLRGADYCSLPFPDPDERLEKSLEEKGVVELSSGAGYPWMRGYLFVSDHPYYTRTDEQGHFHFDKVPPGHYQVVCWMPSWKIVGNARDPESAVVLRVTFAAPVETVGHVDVRTGIQSEVKLTVREKSFPVGSSTVEKRE